MQQSRRSHSQNNLWDKIWKDSEGNVVVWQFPNAPLFVWVIFTLMSLFFSGSTADFFSWIASAGLIVWSLLEIFRGVNYFRRGLGLVILLFSIATVIKTITAN